MGLFNFSSKLIDIIEWLDNSSDTIVFRYDGHDNEIKNGAQLIVRESQSAVFVDQGKFADVFQPGTFSLKTENLPILASLKGWKYGFESPFKSEVYFVKTNLFRDQLWGTSAPITKRDKEFGLIQIRAFGNFSFKITDPVIFLKEVVGTNGHFTTDEINDQLRNFIITRFSDAIGESQVAALDLAANLNEISAYCNEIINKSSGQYGIEIKDFLISSINFPEEIEEAISKRASMNVLGNMNQFAQYQAGKAIEAAANNPGSGASDGLGMGMGMAFASQMANQNTSSNAQQQAPQSPSSPPPIPTQTLFHVVVNNEQAGPYSVSQLKQMVTQGLVTKSTLVWKEGMANWAAIELLPELNSLFASVPPPIPPSM